MKKAIYAVFLSAACMGAASAEPVGHGVTQAPAASSYQPGPSEFDDYAKKFMLEDGRLVEFTQIGRTYYVKLGREPKMKLVPQSAGVFLTANGVRIQFRDYGDEVVISDYDKLAAKSNADPMVMAKR
ncbi:hypothetical protein GCM10027277_16350 [Pseudoduganella ginsengisoli]|uniref:DUF3471 domain-containing protein n=1 Tax=Pseudoduganella ginsengisoli TaxID=1462440 RepID=A0A6L6PUA2_9BURK|nr:hypothetical protein [Pseudoduganella ginsengisoli]MTW01103.1 hypothetical protein [Pseudoduganella ginsengisoli]